MKMTPANKYTILHMLTALLTTEDDVRIGTYRQLVNIPPNADGDTVEPSATTYVLLTRGPVTQLEEDVTGALERGKAAL